MIWQWLNGRKTQIALWFYLGQDVLLPIWLPLGVPDWLNKLCLTISAILVFAGLGHKAIKAKK